MSQVSGPDELLAEVEHWLGPKGDYPDPDATLGLVKIALMVRIRASIAANAALAARCGELERDAERYRSLRGEDWSGNLDRWIGLGSLSGEAFDAAIDARRAALASQAEGER